MERRLCSKGMAALIGCLALAASAVAQVSPAPTPATPASELERARAQLEAAAREVARLSMEAAAPAVDEVVRHFRLTGRRAMLGITIDDAEGGGVAVVGVSPGGPADEGGLQSGDVIMAMDGAELTGADVPSPSKLLVAQMANVDPGETVRLRVRRDGQEHDFEIETRALEPPAFVFAGPRGARAPFDVRVPMPGPLRNFGPWRDMELAELTAALGSYFNAEAGILVVRAPRDERLGLRDGDVIVDIGGRMPRDTAHAMRILTSFEPGETLRLTIMRQQRRQTLEVEVPPNAQRG